MQAHRGCLVLLPILLALSAAPAAAGPVRVYITDSAADAVHVIDAATNKVVQVIKGIEAPHGVTFSPDGARVYVSNESTDTLDVVDRKSGKIIKKVALSGHPNNIAISKDGGRVVVCIRDDPGTLDVVDTGSLTLKKSIPVKGGLHNVYVTPDGKYAVAGSVRKNRLTVVDLATEAVAWDLPFDKGLRPMAIEATPDGSTSRLFIQLSGLNGFAVVDFAQRKEVARVVFPDVASDTDPQGRGSTPAHGIGVAPDGKTLWANSAEANAVFAYALPDLKLIGHVALPELKLPGRAPIGAVPNWITFTPDSRTLYVSNSTLNSVSAIDVSALKIVATI
ncbi:MAG TPA: cytochrome D1 domain-containing protein, partial [Xanthobacteraceae bacterium]|nr:cytochrome D1 domain-containing protein [Xanthobacteraceae bacterium]